MKLCWDNIENVRLNKKGDFYDIMKKRIFHLKICEKCGDAYLGTKQNKACSVSCASKRKHSEETKRKMSENRKGENNPFYGKHHSEETKKKIVESLGDQVKGENNPFYGKHHSEETKRSLSENMKGRYLGKNNPFYGKHHSEESKKKQIMKRLNLHNIEDVKKLYYQDNIPVYNTYAPQLEWCEEVRRNKEDPNILEVRCFRCDEWYIPSLHNTNNRIRYVKGNSKWESHFYCSKECKNSCSIFNKHINTIMKEDAVRAGRLPWLELGREVQSELRQMVLERDEYKCAKCGDSNNLQCHHILPVSIEPLLSADIDNCITLCKECHVKVHKEIDGCGYNQLRNIEEC